MTNDFPQKIRSFAAMESAPAGSAGLPDQIKSSIPPLFLKFSTIHHSKHLHLPLENSSLGVFLSF
jgi:hypothetical protein